MALKLPEKVPHSSCCICEVLYPLIFIARALGIFPISLERNGAEPCGLSDKKCSVYFVHGAAVLFCEIYSSIVCFYFLDEYFSLMFSGTELIVSSLQIKLSYLLLTIMVGNSFFKRGKIKSLYSKIITAHYKLLKHKCELPGITLEYKVACERKYRRIRKRLIPIFVLASLLHATLFTGFFAYHIKASCSKALQNFEYVHPLCDEASSSAIMSTLSFLRVMTPQVFALLFSSFCYVIHMGFSYITCCIKEIMISEEVNEKTTLVASVHDANQSEYQMNNVVDTFEFLRVIHEDFCEIMEKMSEVFGLPILASLVMGVTSVSVGVYSIQAAIMFDKTEIIQEYSGIELEVQRNTTHLWILVIYVSTAQVFMILYFGQIVANAASSPVRYLTNTRFNSINLRMNTQIIQFIDKLGHSSPSIRGLGMTTIRMSLVATLVTSVTTYVLVMLQFKFSID